MCSIEIPVLTVWGFFDTLGSGIYSDAACSMCTKCCVEFRHRHKIFTIILRAYLRKVCYNVNGGEEPPM